MPNKKNKQNQIQTKLLRNFKAYSSSYQHAPLFIGERKEVRKEIEDREKEIKYQAKKQDIWLKRFTLYALFTILFLETATVFLFTYFQAINFMGRFRLDEWSFKLLFSGTLLQITGMLFVAVRHLFPKSR